MSSKILFKVVLIFSLLALAIGASFTPWIYRDPVALQLTAPGIAEYVKFLAEKRLGLLNIQRLHFLLPLAMACLSLPLIAVNKSLRLLWIINWLLRLSVIPFSLMLLSPIWSPGVLLSAEFRLQTLMAGLSTMMAVIAPLFKNLPLKSLVTIITGLALIALVLGLNQFRLANEAIASTYASSVGLGWGGWLSILGGLGLVVSTGWVWKGHQEV